MILNNEDLIEGEFYYCTNYSGKKNNNFIFKCNDIKEGVYISDIVNNVYKKAFEFEGTFNGEDIRSATDEEIHWLNQCILADRYIEKNIAMKSYIEPIKPAIQDDPELSNILIKLLTQ